MWGGKEGGERGAAVYISREVCPASWRPGDETIKPNVSGALQYFVKTADDEVLEYLDAGFAKLQASNSKSKLKKFLTKDVFLALRSVRQLY